MRKKYPGTVNGRPDYYFPWIALVLRLRDQRASGLSGSPSAGGQDSPSRRRGVLARRGRIRRRRTRGQLEISSLGIDDGQVLAADGGDLVAADPSVDDVAARRRLSKYQRPAAFSNGNGQRPVVDADLEDQVGAPRPRAYSWPRMPRGSASRFASATRSPLSSNCCCPARGWRAAPPGRCCAARRSARRPPRPGCRRGGSSAGPVCDQAGRGGRRRPPSRASGSATSTTRATERSLHGLASSACPPGAAGWPLPARRRCDHAARCCTGAALAPRAWYWLARAPSFMPENAVVGRLAWAPPARRWRSALPTGAAASPGADWQAPAPGRLAAAAADGGTVRGAAATDIGAVHRAGRDLDVGPSDGVGRQGRSARRGRRRDHPAAASAARRRPRGRARHWLPLSLLRSTC